ncbi:ABC-type nitrate/sulfonate/bicarbonate transport system, ATPase component [Desulfosporosinus orientis DSM 765]|uniref:ABC-type nitrate/sulfonate/bicarbonate transport system, ATPase component n=1 Tax=Desulfosporosinus orientis (strain ATCC 19365 / DSM 765 / NCIMB 8382 / VKM B-1628 / Singapore I) TaxID=768706 RepID=G7WFR3_DESOD|nr:ABC transporter ATP-binding protein [Desulfosporosinus orientis]AET68936.1 ABC-type nitrate/sulfonate/bicarbonate transport system, ATPase component [Desulfosporosinus orientis DSM 765]
MGLSLKSLSKSYLNPQLNQPMKILDSLNLEVDSGTFVSLIGPSGCGKSTICNLIAGIDNPDFGDIILDGQKIQGLPGHIGYMPQKDLLLPWRTLFDNLLIGCQIQHRDKLSARAEATKWLNQFGLTPFSNHYPHQLSGGMRQRGALLRTILFGKKTLLLDEPFGALDALTRQEMQHWLLSILSQTQYTVLFITHDIDEAILLSDKVVVLSKRPATIIQEFTVSFPHPRNPELLLSKESLELKKQLLQLLIN